MKAIFRIGRVAFFALMTFAYLFVDTSAYAQTAVNGKAIDANKGTRIGTVTGVEGSFLVPVSHRTNLDVSSIGQGSFHSHANQIFT